MTNLPQKFMQLQMKLYMCTLFTAVEKLEYMERVIHMHETTSYTVHTGVHAIVLPTITTLNVIFIVQMMNLMLHNHTITQHHTCNLTHYY